MSAFNGENKAGEWSLTINDAFAGDDGVLEQYGLLFCEPADGDCGHEVDLLAWGDFQICFSGDGSPATAECVAFDGDCDHDVDLQDFAVLGCTAAGHDR